MSQTINPRLVNVTLALGALLGLALAASGVLAPRTGTPRALPGGAIALVDGRPITDAQYHQALAAVSADRRERALDGDLRQHVLERLIDDELLVQRGLELGLAGRDPRVRADLGVAVIDQITAQAEAEQPDDAALRAFYADNQSFFARPPRVRVHQHWFTDRAAAEAGRADWLAARPVESSSVPAPVPDRLLPAPKLRDYVGATATRFALDAAPGAISEVLPAAGGFRVVRVLERVPAQVRELDDIRDLVRAEYMRRAGERAVREFLDRRRARVPIVVAEDRL